MENVPLSALFAALAVLLVLSGFFSGSETAMMAANRYKLRHKAEQGSRGAKLALALLERVDRLISLILLGNTLINAAAATLTSYIALALFGKERWALEGGTLFITFCLLVFSEITPKVVAATYADRITPILGYILTPLQRLATPVTTVVNVFVNGLLRLFRLHQTGAGDEHDSRKLSPEELRLMVLESGHFIPSKHHSILVNLFDLERITVEDVMAPRGSIEAIDLDSDWTDIVEQLTTAYHTRLPVYRGELNNMVGIVHLRRLLGAVQRGELTLEALTAQAQEPYFIPAATPVFSQLQFFQEKKQRVGIVVDEFGEVQGLVTLDDIIEEIIGEFTTSTAELGGGVSWDEDGCALVEGGRSLREINRKLGLNFPLNGPKTLNGLIIEHFQDIPEAGVGLKIGGIPIEVVQTHDRSVKTARLFRPAA